MAKKMSLKDFHGGSIPSDLPLPSAPGLTVRPMDRPSFDRPSPWGNPMGRSHQLRPGSAGSARNNFDDKTPFLGPIAHIGRNFDEDERRPLDGVSGPRRTVSDDSIRALSMRADVAKPDYSVAYRPSPCQQVSRVSPISYAGRVAELPIDGTGTKIGRSSVSVAEVSPVNHSDVASKLAHASALDKVSSGMWQLNKQPIHHLANLEPIRGREIEKSGHSADVAGGGEYLVRHVERDLTVNDASSPNDNDKVENKFQIDKIVESGIPSRAVSEQSERPKLKLLPRSKPLGSSEPPIDHYQGYHQPQNYDHLHKVNELNETGNTTKSVLTVSDSGNLGIERPKLNLKPRAQSIEQLENNKREKGRSTVFGVARPRELVLKERGVDDIVANNHDLVQPPNRIKQDIPRSETIPSHATPSRYNSKVEGPPHEHNFRKNNDKHKNRLDAESTNTQKRNWNQQQPHHLQERPPSPETWRKPVEEPRPTSSDGSGLRPKKAASAVELAQAFSRSVSDPKMVDRLPNPKGQIPFSRLTAPPSRAQINGY